ncbi:restriction endonuclease subunit S [Xanthomarina sp. F2636L]|uniref:restriction endonuclease subunit S n=1 Tax=Xanthomarina sp. F2636L TaxID=2996018 RepID=UPI00225E06B9|nr:restriction endonuclease subunit S [Xanthomarina sp. F2636L]MCX7552120.1 restriction endonuclease subunit S [Xanthomarina sp. F2636L]
MREDWIECTLREVCKIGSSKRILKKEYVSEGIPFYRTKEIKELSLGKEISIELYISNEKYNDIKNRFDIPKKGDVLISAVGTIGITYTIKNNDPFYFKDGNLIWLSDIQGLESTFLNLGLTHFVRNSSILKTSGSAYNALTIEKLNSLPFPLPPLVQQKAIVKKIEELFSSLDSGIADLKKAQDQLVIYRQAVLKKAFEGELTKTKLKISVIEDFIHSVEYGTSEKSLNEGDVPVLRMGNMQNGLIDWSDLKYTSNKSDIQKYILNYGDVLFNRTNSPEHVGKTSIFLSDNKAIFAGYLIRINYDKEKLSGKYLTYYLNSHKAKIYGNEVKTDGVNQSNINGTKLKKYPLPICSLEEQHQIVQEIESRLSVCDKVEKDIADSLEKAQALRQSILKKAFEGTLLSEEEIAKCKADAAYEPASVLLEKIKSN